AAGDVASFTARPLEKAGVFAVRMGPPLAKNLRLSLRGQPLVAYNPQQRWLALISTGDRYAVASRGALGFAGAWVWTWKDWIDRRFMRKFTELPAMADASPAAATPTSSLVLSAEESRQAISAIAMRCGGCGAKVGASILTRALGSLQPVERDDVLIGLHAPDDAAVVRVPPGKAMVHTVDFFRSFIDDPYLFGQVAANHALGDIFAMGAEPQSATAIATVPPGLEAKVEDLLLQMMTGAVEVLNAAGCALVGGHTGEGRELALGFAINGLIDEQMDGVMRKGGMLPGDVLLLTKPIGTGTLFAAHARYAAKGRWIDAALKSMVVSNQAGAQILRAHGATACTDLTGFGLLGHLVEMTRPSGVDAELQLSALPLLDGAVECVEAGIVSSLQPANVRLRRALRNAEDFVKDPRYPLLFDPQTAGGLLASVPADRATDCIRALKAAGYPQTAAIGRIRGASDVLEPVVLTA
ncbi:MAG: selenide, water dikinase SelD, partial [Betaproteobacteria bacterium HGW-Betaproteobacteria-15]